MCNYLKSSISFHWFVLDCRSGIGVFMANALLHRLHGTATSNHSVAQISLSIHWKHTTNICKAQTSWIFIPLYLLWVKCHDMIRRQLAEEPCTSRVHAPSPSEPSGCLRSFQIMFSYTSSFITTVFYGVIPIDQMSQLLSYASSLSPPYSMVSFPLIKCLSSFPSF